jgi:hypothetical protein
MKKVFLAVFILTATVSFGQNVELAKTQLNFNVLPLTLSFEGKLDDNKSITLAGGLGFVAEYETSTYGGSSGNFYVLPMTYMSFRNYYSRKNVRKNNLRNNSGNYVGLFGLYQFAALNHANSEWNGFDIPGSPVNNIYAVGPVWGIQRNYASGIHLGLSLGVGVIGGKYIDTTAGYIGEFEFGILLFQNK